MKRFILIVYLLVWPSVVLAQVSLNVSVDDRVYRAIDRLVAVGAVDHIIVGQRPYAQSDIQRIFEEAGANIDRLKKPADKMMVYRLLKYWAGKFPLPLAPSPQGRGVRVKPLAEFDFSYEYFSEPTRRIPATTLGSVDAIVQPMTEYREGRHYIEGHNYSFETEHWLRGPYFVLFAHPHFQLQIPEGDVDGQNRVYVQELYGKFGINNFEVEVGRDHLVWGQGEFGGLLFSNNARGLDFLKISNPSPLRLKYVGDIKGTILVGNMGPYYNYPYSYLTAWKLSITPWQFTEFGFYYGLIIGGDGAPSLSAGDVAKEFFAFIPGVGEPANTRSMKMGGFDARFRIPPLSDVELYGEVFFEDGAVDDPGEMFGEKAAYLGGIYFPRIGRANNMALRFEYKRTGSYIYRNPTWRDGWAIGGFLVGDPLGPDADGIYANFYYDLAQASRLIARFAYEKRENAGVSEDRYRGMLSLEVPIKKIWTGWTFGCEATKNFNLIPNFEQKAVFIELHLGTT